MRLVSFNINGVRARPHQLEALKQLYDPDVIGLQETKVHDDEFPREMIRELGFEVSFHGQKGHYGVAILSKMAASETLKGLPNEAADEQRRLIHNTFAQAAGMTVINGYFPQGENREHPTKFPHKRRFYAELTDHVKGKYQPTDALVIMGDLNISHQDIDIGIGEVNAKRWLREGKTSFLPEERDWLDYLLSWGLHDSYRLIHPDNAERFSWFDYRSKGFDREPKRGLRIDSILVSDALKDKVTDAGIAYDIRSMEKPSDHCPVWVDLDL